MRGEAAFGEILDRKIGEVRRASAPPAPLPAALPTPLFLFATSARSFGCDIRRPAAGSAYGARRAAPRPAAPARAFSTADHRAAEDLRRFGADGLDGSFTDADLRRVYRLLARRFHPDAHPMASEGERAYLADAFGRITGAYRQLMHSFPAATRQ
jgi:hypothetical protein